MDWNSIVEGIKTFFNQPVAIIGCSVGCLLFYTLVFLSKTSFGKKSIRKVNNAFDELKQGYEENKAQLGEKVAYLQNEYADTEVSKIDVSTYATKEQVNAIVSIEDIEGEEGKTLNFSIIN